MGQKHENICPIAVFSNSDSILGIGVDRLPEIWCMITEDISSITYYFKPYGIYMQCIYDHIRWV